MFFLPIGAGAYLWGSNSSRAIVYCGPFFLVKEGTGWEGCRSGCGHVFLVILFLSRAFPLACCYGFILVGRRGYQSSMVCSRPNTQVLLSALVQSISPASM